MQDHALIDTIRPDHPAESAVRVVAHWGGMEFVEVTSITGIDEDWTLQLDLAQAQGLADALGHALSRTANGEQEDRDRERAEEPARLDRLSGQ